jgi:hypothetical protein
MSAFTNSLASSLLASSILILGGVTPVLAQYSCPPREIQSVDEVGDFKFELQGCQRQGKKVTCQAWVTANKDVTVTYLAGNNYTRLIDTSGTQYVPSSVQGANQTSVGGMNIPLVKDIPMKISATFADMPTLVQDIALFEVNINYGKGQFRNIKITESKMGTYPSPIKKK